MWLVPETGVFVKMKICLLILMYTHAREKNALWLYDDEDGGGRSTSVMARRCIDDASVVARRC
jgi:hypothetical protein